MRLPLTDKFLLNLYNFIEEIDRGYDLFAPRTMKEALAPELYKLRREYARKQARRQFSRLLYYLKKKGYIKIKSLKQGQGILLTKKGADRILTIKFKTKAKKRRHDRKWQMIIFDVPERKRHLRDLLRDNLQILGYKMLQQSVWICPFDVFKETERIIRKYSLNSYVRLFLIAEIKL